MANKEQYKQRYFSDGNVFILASCEVEAREKAIELRREYEAKRYEPDDFLIETEDDRFNLVESEKEWGNYVYVMQCEAGPVKIGVATSVVARCAMIQTGNPYKVSVVAAFMCGRSVKVERKAHKILAEKRMSGEWFDASAVEAVEAVQQAAREQGCLVLPVWEEITALALQCGRQRDMLGQVAA